MAVDPDSFRDLLIERHGGLEEENRISAGDRARMTLDQEIVGRLLRIGAMQVQAMALAQERRRKSERLELS